MKILHVYKDFYPPVKGGIEYHLNLLVKGLKYRGVDVEVLVSNTSNRFDEECFDGIRVFKAPQWGRFYSAPLTPTFHYSLRQIGKRADIIHFHYPNPTAELSYFFTKLNKKLIVTYHSDIIRQDKLGKLYSPFRRIFLKRVDRIIATSPNYIQSSTVLNQFKQKCTVIPLGTNVERFRSDVGLSKIDQIIQDNKGLPIILFVGCFRYYKGLHLLITAMKNVPAKLLLIGAGPEEFRLRRLVEKKSLDRKIFFLGELPDAEVNLYYKACDIFVLPSHLRSEAFGLVQLEAMCCRKPVISTELGTGTSFVNIHQKTGIVVEPNNVSALSEAINYLIDHPEKRIQYGKCGYQRVNQFFTAEKMVEKTIELYREIINEDQRIIPQSFEKYRRKGVDDKKVKVLRVVSRFNIGGPSIHVKNLTEGLNGKRIETKLITGSVSPSEGDMSYISNFKKDIRIVVPELQREINLRKDLIALFKTILIIHKFRPDIVHSHTSKAGTIARLAAMICNFFSKQKIIVVHTFHGHVLDAYFGHTKTSIFQKIEHMLAKATDRIIAISNTQKWELSKKYKIANPSKISLINLGFDLRPFVHSEKFKGKLRNKIGVSNDTLLIGIVGRFAPIKNHKMFLDAAASYLDIAADKKVKFLLIGDGELRPTLESYCLRIGLKDQVIFYGWEKNIPMIYADLNILALTSLNEGTPVSIIEAMAASVPVVTTGVGGIKDLLGKPEVEQPDQATFKICQRGILCPKDDPYSFSSALAYMIGNGYLLDHGRIARAREYVLKNYSVDRLISDMEALYGSLMVR
jgi:glycosyltransferase involved in cell wall biosynthesis